MSVGSDTVTPATAPSGGVLERFFKFKANGTTLRRDTHRRPHDLHGHVVHHLREPVDPELRRHPEPGAQGAAVRRRAHLDLPRGRRS